MTPGEESAKQEGVDEERRKHFIGTTKTGALKATWSLAVIGFFFVVALGLNISYTNEVQQQGNRQSREALTRSEQVWCGVLGLILRTPTINTSTQIDFREKLANLATFYGCLNVPDKPPTLPPTLRPGKPSPSTTATPRS